MSYGGQIQFLFICFQFIGDAIVNRIIEIINFVYAISFIVIINTNLRAGNCNMMKLLFFLLDVFT